MCTLAWYSPYVENFIRKQPVIKGKDFVNISIHPDGRAHGRTDRQNTVPRLHTPKSADRLKRVPEGLSCIVNCPNETGTIIFKLRRFSNSYDSMCYATLCYAIFCNNKTKYLLSLTCFLTSAHHTPFTPIHCK